ncbi:MAG: L-seryl-tRNA(Sec) selenium transferase [Gemmatimonadota bacterium]|nr:L-seryl-tRNA(Sec) selenium transferase [Gemmatimonadota bacterium]MDE2873768.1 L-seryl-tRNA(Sec) selenium transferase [Gemmatimonadota bacterium]
MAAHRDRRRAIPGVDRLLARPWCRLLVESHGRAWVTARLRAVLEEIRTDRIPLPASEDGFEELLRREIARAGTPSLRSAVNATGVILHTNLGRAPLAAEARAAMARAAAYGNVEFDLETGRRGSRYVHCAGLVTELTGAEAALVVNNGAGAVALALTAFAAGKGVAVSHGELVEIGGGFRIPEVVEAAGARLVTVGTTNRTRPADYARAIGGGGVAAILKVHRSNFSMAGFTEETGLAELVALGAETGVPVIHDLGSGLLADSAELGLPAEPTPAGSVAAGVDLVAFSGDKLLGGPQAGILAGTRAGVGRARAHPLCRALRCDKVTLAGLEATLALYRDPGRARARIPVLRMIAARAEELGSRAGRVAEGVAERRAARGAAPLAADVVQGESLVGGGTFPDARLPTAVLRIRAGDEAEAWMAELRAHDPPVVARSREGRILIDLRAVAPEEEAALVSALAVLGRTGAEAP